MGSVKRTHLGIGGAVVAGVWLVAHAFEDVAPRERATIGEVERSAERVDGDRGGEASVVSAPGLDAEAPSPPSRVAGGASTRVAVLERQRVRLERTLDRMVTRREQLEAEGGNVEAVGALKRHETRVRRELQRLGDTGADEPEPSSGG